VAPRRTRARTAAAQAAAAAAGIAAKKVPDRESLPASVQECLVDNILYFAPEDRTKEPFCRVLLRPCPAAPSAPDADGNVAPAPEPMFEKRYITLHLDNSNPDFLVPITKWRTSLGHDWKEGARVRMFYYDEDGGSGGSYYSGTVMATPDPDLDPWECLGIIWDRVRRHNFDDDDVTHVSPWEVEVGPPPCVDLTCLRPTSTTLAGQDPSEGSTGATRPASWAG